MRSLVANPLVAEIDGSSPGGHEAGWCESMGIRRARTFQPLHSSLPVDGDELSGRGSRWHSWIQDL